MHAFLFVYLGGEFVKIEVKKVFNNNVILVHELEKNVEAVVVGKGIGFGKKNGKQYELDESDISKVFKNMDSELGKEYNDLIKLVDPEVIGLTEEIIQYATSKLGELNYHIHIMLTDHIAFAIERLKDDQEIINPFLYEIKALYPREFEVSEYAKNLINKRMGIMIPDGEKGFIAMHIHSAMKNKAVKETVENARILTEVIEIIEEYMNIRIKKDDLSYVRLVHHINTAIIRMETNHEIENPLLDNIKKEMKSSFILANKIGNHIVEAKGISINEHELGYLALHIERLSKIS